MGIEGSTLVMKQNYVPISGGSMRGLLTLNADPQGPMEAVTRRYLEKRISSILNNYVNNNMQITIEPYIKRTGDTMSGILTLSGDPVGNLDAATKQYVDGKFTNILPQIGLPGQCLMVNANASGLYYSAPLNSVYTGGSNINITNNVISLSTLQSAQQSDIYFNIGLRNDGLLVLKPNPLPNFNAISATVVNPPINSNIGNTYIVPVNATGVWAGQQNRVAVNYNGSNSWIFTTAAVNSIYTVSDTNISWQWNGTSWIQHPTFLPMGGGNLSGPLTLSGDPTAPYGAATKHYVDMNSFSCLISSNLNQTVTANNALIMFPSTGSNYVIFDTYAMHSTINNNTRITIQTTGTYKIKCSARVSNNTADMNLGIYRNGASTGFMSYSQSLTVGGHCSLSHSELISCSTGDYLEVYIGSSSLTYSILWGSFFVSICK